MKKILLLFTILCSAAFFSGCEKDGGSGSYSKKIIGTWSLVSGFDSEGLHYYDVITEDSKHYKEWEFSKSSVKFFVNDYGKLDLEFEAQYTIEDNSLFVMGVKYGTIEKLTSTDLIIHGDRSFSRKMVFKKKK